MTLTAIWGPYTIAALFAVAAGVLLLKGLSRLQDGRPRSGFATCAGALVLLIVGFAAASHF